MSIDTERLVPSKEGFYYSHFLRGRDTPFSQDHVGKAAPVSVRREGRARGKPSRLFTVFYGNSKAEQDKQLSPGESEEFQQGLGTVAFPSCLVLALS